MGGSRGLATAVAAELRLAREQAITKGSPVAVVFRPGVSRSLFTLEGNTEPRITRVVNYQGDYPDGAIAVATYSGPTFAAPPEIVGSKATAWQERLDDWLPDTFSDHNVFMFTPNGSVVTNGLSAADGSFRLIVGMGIELSGTELNAAGEPYTIALSQSGAVEFDKGLLGGTGGVNTFGANSPIGLSPPVVTPPPAPEAPEILVEFSKVTPPPEELDGSMVHVLDKGEYLTLELYAKSRDGLPLYAGWVDTPTTKTGDEFRGRFSIPVEGDGPVFERMEFFPSLEVDGTLQTDVWRSVWTWTPPSIAEAGDRYSLQADVKDSTLSVPVSLPPPPPVVLAPPGDIIFESNRTGRWQLHTMWANGKGVRQLTKGDQDSRCASVTADGETVAFERNGNEVWVMNIDGTGQTLIAAGRAPTISPIGSAVAFLAPGTNDIVIKRIDFDTGASDSRGDTVITNVAGQSGTGVHNRLAFSPNGRMLYYTGNSTVSGRCVASVRLSYNGGGVAIDGPTVFSAPVNNIATVGNPALGGLYTCRNTGRVFYHADHNDPYLGYFEADPDGHIRGVNDLRRTSVGQGEAFPAPSPGGDVVLFNETIGGLGGQYQILSVPIGQFTAAVVGQQLTGLGPNEGINLRPAWIKQKSGI
jgi:hypothetical protein